MWAAAVEGAGTDSASPYKNHGFGRPPGGRWPRAGPAQSPSCFAGPGVAQPTRLEPTGFKQVAPRWHVRDEESTRFGLNPNQYLVMSRILGLRRWTGADSICNTHGVATESAPRAVKKKFGPNE